MRGRACERQRSSAAGARECNDESEPADDPHGLGPDGDLPFGGAELSLAMLGTIIWIARPDGFDVAGGSTRTSR